MKRRLTFKRYLDIICAPSKQASLVARFESELAGERILIYLQEEGLANLKSSLKRIRSSRRRAAYNRIHRSRSKTLVKKARGLITDKKLDEAQEAIRQAISALDKAAQKGVLHKNNAARRKSRLMKLYNQAKAQS